MKNSQRESRKTRARPHIHNPATTANPRHLNTKKQRLAIVPDDHLLRRSHGGQIHPLIPLQKQFEVRVKLGDLILGELHDTPKL